MLIEYLLCLRDWLGTEDIVEKKDGQDPGPSAIYDLVINKNKWAHRDVISFQLSFRDVWDNEKQICIHIPYLSQGKFQINLIFKVRKPQETQKPYKKRLITINLL